MIAEAVASKPALSVADKLTLSLIEASQLSGLSRGHLRQAIEEKKLRARIIGKGWRMIRADLDAYVAKL
jgi:excisionase family DNA binding protein